MLTIDKPTEEVNVEALLDFEDIYHAKTIHLK